MDEDKKIELQLEQPVPVTYYVVRGYLTPTGEKTFSNQQDAVKEAKHLTENDWVNQVTVIKHEVIVSWVRKI